MDWGTTSQYISVYMTEVIRRDILDPHIILITLLAGPQAMVQLLNIMFEVNQKYSEIIRKFRSSTTSILFVSAVYTPIGYKLSIVETSWLIDHLDYS